jgi:hypothetical protein
LVEVWIKKRHKEHCQELAHINANLSKLQKEIREDENYMRDMKGFEEKMNASFSYQMKHRLKATDPVRYRDVNVLTRDLFALGTFYTKKVPTHPAEEDSWRLKDALQTISMKKTRITSLQKPEPSATVGFEDVSDDETPPVKKACVEVVNTAPPSATPPSPFAPPYQAAYVGYGQCGYGAPYPSYPSSLYLQPTWMPSFGSYPCRPFDYTIWSIWSDAAHVQCQCYNSLSATGISFSAASSTTNTSTINSATTATPSTWNSSH